MKRPVIVDTCGWLPLAESRREDGERIGFYRAEVGGYRLVAEGSSTYLYDSDERAAAVAHYARIAEGRAAA